MVSDLYLGQEHLSTCLYVSNELRVKLNVNRLIRPHLSRNCLVDLLIEAAALIARKFMR